MTIEEKKGIRNLSQLIIDADKDWVAMGISNLKEIALGMARGDMAYHDGSIISKLSPSTIGMQLLSAGPGKAPGWGYADTGILGYPVISVVNAGPDDSEGNGGVFSNASTEVRAGNIGGSVLHSAMRFRNITIPAGAKILSAYISFVCQFTRAGQTVLSRVYGEKSANPAQYGAAENFLLRTTTSNFISWTPAANWTVNQQQNTVELISIVQELVDAYGPYVNGVMAFQWRDNGSGANNFHSAYSYDAAPGLAPGLVIRWRLP